MSDKYDFLKQKEGEEIILVVKQHPWYFFITFLEILILTGIFALIFIIFKSGIVVSWSAIILSFFGLYMIARNWFVWQSQMYIVTNERIVSVEQKGWFNHSVGESALENILFINHEIKGPIKTMFNFGDVHIRASGVTEDELLFRNVSNPYEIQQIIVKAQRERLDSSGANEPSKNENRKVLLR